MLICFFVDYVFIRRPSGKDTEFFLQLFVEKSETVLFTMKEMLFQSMKEQRISFAEVHSCVHTAICACVCICMRACVCTCVHACMCVVGMLMYM